MTGGCTMECLSVMDPEFFHDCLKLMLFWCDKMATTDVHNLNTLLQDSGVLTETDPPKFCFLC